LVDKKIQAIKSLWNDLNIPEEKRVLPESCSGVVDRNGAQKQPEEQEQQQDYDSLLDKALNDLDEMRDALQESLRELKSLNDDIKKRETLVAERIKFDDEVQDSERFKRRGYNWKQELKQRKLYHEYLPNLEEKLVVRLRKWNESHESPFFFDGINYLEKLMEEHDEYVRQQQLQQQQKAKHLRTRSANDAETGKIRSKRRLLRRSLNVHSKRRGSDKSFRLKKRQPGVVAVDVDESDNGKTTAKKRGADRELVLGGTLKKRMRRADDDSGSRPTRMKRRSSKRTATKPTLWR